MTSMNAVDVWLSCARRLLAGAALLFLSLSGSVAMSVSAHAAEQESAAGTSDAKLSFDIASQPLEDALYTFGAVTGIEVFVDGGAVKERRSTEVRGSFTVSQALRLLLTGTGLEAQSIGVRAITLTQPPPEQSSVATYKRYSALLQNAAVRRLCGEGDATPSDFGSYRIAMRVWLNEAGGVRDVELLSSTGDRTRDDRILDLLRGIHIERPPPTLPQPVVMVILPRPPRESGDCTFGSAASGRDRTR